MAPTKLTIGLAALLFSVFVFADDDAVRISEGFFSIKAVATAPVPDEVENDTQARALSRDAAIMRAQNAILTHVLKKKTRHYKSMAEAEIPSVDLQNDLRATIKGAKITKTRWVRDVCIVYVTLDKSHINSLRRKH